MTTALDKLDTRILDLLQQDVSLSVNEIASRVASSKSVVARRIQKLVDSGIIRKRVAVLDPQKVGLGLLVFAHIKMARHDRDVLPKFVEAVKRFPQVIECHTLMGNVDFQLKIVARDVAEYEELLWRRLSRIDGVHELHSYISMTQFINTTRLPLEPAGMPEAVKPLRGRGSGRRGAAVR
ncbi:MAG: Lrp/AsnC family transcriptional regulator [Nevskiales bacterium]